MGNQGVIKLRSYEVVRLWLRDDTLITERTTEETNNTQIEKRKEQSHDMSSLSNQ